MAHPSSPKRLLRVGRSAPPKAAARADDANSGSRADTRETVRDEFRRLQAIVKNGQKVMLEAARALRTIRDRELYKPPHTTFTNFEEYVERTYSFSVRTAQYRMQFADYVDSFIEAGTTPPVMMAQSRALSRLPEDVRIPTWARLVDEHGSPSAVTPEMIVACLPATSAAATVSTTRRSSATGATPDPTEGWDSPVRRMLARVPYTHRAAVAAHVNEFAAELGREPETWMVEETIDGYTAAVLEDGGDAPATLAGDALALAEEARRDAADASCAPDGTADAPITDLTVLTADDLQRPPAFKRGSLFLGSAERTPLLVSLPRIVTPRELAGDLPADVKHVVVEISELERLGGPVRGGVLDLSEIRSAAREAGFATKLQRTNEHVDWARWTINQLTGCQHACMFTFCYAAGIARRLFAQGFLPTLHPARLDAYSRTSVPTIDGLNDEAAWRERSVFNVSMGDLFGRWVPSWYIESVLGEIRQNPQWFAFLLTKHPERLAEFDFPANCAVGLTITGDEDSAPDAQARRYSGYAAALGAVRGCAFTWLSLEPFRGEVHDLQPFFDAGVQLVAVGAQSQTVLSPPRAGDPLIVVPAMQPDIRWVESVREMCDRAGVMRFEKENLAVRRKDLPWPSGRPA